MKRLLFIVILLLAASLLTTLAQAQSGYQPLPQTPELWYNEARMIYLSNLERENLGLPPMRANLQLNNAARWFSWDSVVHRSEGFCDHQDTQGNHPDKRTRAFGYLGGSGAEDAYCGYLEPEEAVAGWMASKYHRLNIIDPNTREAGAGYYLEEDGRGYEVLDFGHDLDYAPLVINGEALTTDNPQVNLYIYDREQSDSFTGYAPAAEMQISSDACFSSTDWEPYSSRRAWTLTDGPGGWRSVYVRTRDRFGRVLSASDQIWYGAGFTPGQLAAGQLSTTQEEAPLYGLDSSGLPLMQFSPGWLADDTTATFSKLSGDGSRVDDPDAWGGTSFHLQSSGTSVWMYQYGFYQNLPMTAYVRLKVSSRSPGEVARISVTGGKDLVLRGTDFDAADQYQEFALDFNVPASKDFLIIQVDRTGSAGLYFDAVTFFTAPVASGSEYRLRLPGGNYRGQGIWVRYLDGEGRFTPFKLAETVRRGLEVQPRQVNLLVARDHSAPEETRLSVIETCSTSGWRVDSGADWLAAEVESSTVRLRVWTDNLPDGDSQSQVTIVPLDGSEPVILPVQVRVVDRLRPLYLPLLP